MPRSGLTSCPAPREIGAQTEDDEASIAEAQTMALDAVALLRWLIDPSATGPSEPLDPQLKAALEPSTTDEMRRALRRLELRFLGKERPRPPQKERRREP